MRKGKVLPRLAATGVMKNGMVYFPYMAAGIFSVFVWFVFSSILHNDIINILPHSEYVWMLLMIGRVLFGIILVPFLFYTNSFLMKRRKKEIGLYSILGLEKKHIGTIMVFETAIIYMMVMIIGVIAGVVFSKLIFLLLLNMTGLPIDVSFVFTWEALWETVVFFAAVYGFNLMANLFSVSRSNPSQLLGGGKRGEKEPRYLLLPALLGMVLLGIGYAISIKSEMNSSIFGDFFLAVLLVVIGTYFLFTTGSIVLLRILKKKKGTYYKPENFITISGMLYRMKKNAAGLSNICIFSTIVMITLTCTASLYKGVDEILDYDYPTDVEIEYMINKLPEDKINAKIKELEPAYDVTVSEKQFYSVYCKDMDVESNNIHVLSSNTYGMWWEFNLLTLEDYNVLEEENQTLEEDEILLFSTGKDPEWSTVSLQGKEYRIKEQPQEIATLAKNGENDGMMDYYVVFKDEEARQKCLQNIMEAEGAAESPGADRMFLTLEGGEDNIYRFINDLNASCQADEGYRKISNNFEERARLSSMMGGLLFIGIFFGIIFTMFLLLVMYYKQVTEGYEDQKNFSIMQKVGMSDREIKHTIQRQILLVFFLPLAGAVLHTLAGLFMVNTLFGSIRLYNTALVFTSAGIVGVIFLIFYGGSYLATAKTYYRIIKMK